MKAARFYDRGDIRIGVEFVVQICMSLWKDRFLFHRVDIRILFQANLHRLRWDMSFQVWFMP